MLRSKLGMEMLFFLTPRLYRTKRHVNIKKVENLFFLKDDQISIYASRKVRLSRYLFGIMNKLESLHKTYLLEEIEINSDDVVIDVGANIGELSLYIIKKYNSYPICFEPDCTEFNSLKRNIITGEIHNIGLWESEGVLKFFNRNDNGDSSFIRNNDNEVSFLEVKVNTLDNIINNRFQNIKILKIEAEGAEPEILNGAKETIKKCEYISIDCGPERGENNESTFIQCYNLLREDFEIIRYNPKRSIFLFKKI